MIEKIEIKREEGKRTFATENTEKSGLQKRAYHRDTEAQRK